MAWGVESDLPVNNLVSAEFHPQKAFVEVVEQSRNPIDVWRRFVDQGFCLSVLIAENQEQPCPFPVDKRDLRVALYRSGYFSPEIDKETGLIRAKRMVVEDNRRRFEKVFLFPRLHGRWDEQAEEKTPLLSFMQIPETATARVGDEAFALVFDPEGAGFVFPEDKQEVAGSQVSDQQEDEAQEPEGDIAVVFRPFIFPDGSFLYLPDIWESDIDEVEFTVPAEGGRDGVEEDVLREFRKRLENKILRVGYDEEADVFILMKVDEQKQEDGSRVFRVGKIQVPLSEYAENLLQQEEAEEKAAVDEEGADESEAESAQEQSEAQADQQDQPEEAQTQPEQDQELPRSDLSELISALRDVFPEGEVFFNPVGKGEYDIAVRVGSGEEDEVQDLVFVAGRLSVDLDDKGQVSSVSLSTTRVSPQAASVNLREAFQDEDPEIVGRLQQRDEAFALQLFEGRNGVLQPEQRSFTLEGREFSSQLVLFVGEEGWQLAQVAEGVIQNTELQEPLFINIPFDDLDKYPELKNILMENDFDYDPDLNLCSWQIREGDGKIWEVVFDPETNTFYSTIRVGDSMLLLDLSFNLKVYTNSQAEAPEDFSEWFIRRVYELNGIEPPDNLPEKLIIKVRDGNKREPFLEESGERGKVGYDRNFYTLNSGGKPFIWVLFDDMDSRGKIEERWQFFSPPVSIEEYIINQEGPERRRRTTNLLSLFFYSVMARRGGIVGEDFNERQQRFLDEVKDIIHGLLQEPYIDLISQKPA